MKKRSERRKHCTLAVVRRNQKISPRHRPLPGGAGRPKFNQLEMVTTFTYRSSLVKMHTISSYRGNRPTNKQTHKHTHKQTGPITIHCTTKLSAQCNYYQTENIIAFPHLIRVPGQKLMPSLALVPFGQASTKLYCFMSPLHA